MAQLMPLPPTALASEKSRLVLPFWYRLTWVVLDKGPLNVFVCVRARVRVCMNPLNFVAVILKVLLVNLLAALNCANVFLK